MKSLFGKKFSFIKKLGMGQTRTLLEPEQISLDKNDDISSGAPGNNLATGAVVPTRVFAVDEVLRSFKLVCLETN